MDLVVDIGNTAIKAAVFREKDIVRKGQWQDDEKNPVPGWLAEIRAVELAILSSVRKDDTGLKGMLEKAGVKVMVLDERTPLPIANRYRSAPTLGRDRIAAAVGANARFPGQNILVIDAGTAITIDFVSAANEFTGGNISPGLSMRFRSLHEQTGRLPLVEAADLSFLLAEDTPGAIRAGVQYGIIFELDEYINRQKIRYPDLRVIITGGDAKFFDKKLKNSIFVDPDLNLYGLQRILHHNADN
jgi:type III pantothenate kinase